MSSREQLIALQRIGKALELIAAALESDVAAVEETEPVPAFVRYLPGNIAHYMQDMSFYVGVPHGVKFEVEQIRGMRGFRLRALGFGHRHDYGNGAIFVKTLVGAKPV